MRLLGHLLVVLAVSGCSFQHGGVHQETTRDGSPGDGARDAVIVDASIDAPVVPDAAPSSSCGNACTMEGGTCNGTTCDLGDTGGLTCPPSTPCVVSCPVDDSCHSGGFTCEADANCRLDCVGDHTCDNGQTLTCAAGSTCDVHCDGLHACDNATIDCQAGATCIIHCCGGFGSCANGHCNGQGCKFSFSCP